MTNQTEADPTVDDSPIDEGSLTIKRGVPVTIEELAALASVGAAIRNIEARFTIAETIRARSVMATFPTDWVVFKQPEEQGGQITGYLMDAGAKRALAGAGVEVFDVSDPQRIEGTEPGTFSIRFYASGRSGITGQTIERVLGSRSSTDDACKGLTGVPLEDKVLKMARANCDGNVARKLIGLQNFPAEELARVWARLNPPRDVEKCNRGRGFGTKDDRQGRGAAPNVPPPKCTVCGRGRRVARGQGRQARLLLLPESCEAPCREEVVPRRAGLGRQAAGAPEPPVQDDGRGRLEQERRAVRTPCTGGPVQHLRAAAGGARQRRSRVGRSGADEVSTRSNTAALSSGADDAGGGACS